MKKQIRMITYLLMIRQKGEKSEDKNKITLQIKQVKKEV